MTMDHAAAHEHLADLALEPRRLRAIAADPSPDGAAFRVHLASCEDCRAELEEWQRVYAALDLAVIPDAGEPGATNGRLADLPRTSAAPPSALRARVLAGVHEAGPAPAPASRRSRHTVARGWPMARIAVLAAIAVAIVTGGIAVDRGRQLEATQAQAADLAAATATLDRILAAPDHWVATLHEVDGKVGGTLAWSDTEVVVLASTLPPPAAGSTYHCWIERAGQRTPVGTMSFAGEVGYWAGEVGSWGASLEPGSRFGVSLVSSDGSGTASAVLIAQL